jgi:hypothetical protein
MRYLRRSLKQRDRYLGDRGKEDFKEREGLEEAVKTLSEESSPRPDYLAVYSSLAEKRPLKQGSELGISGDEYLVSLDESRVFALAPAAYYIWNLCDGVRSVNDILKKIEDDLRESGEQPLEESELKQIIAMVLTELNNVGLITWV